MNDIDVVIAYFNPNCVQWQGDFIGSGGVYDPERFRYNGWLALQVARVRKYMKFVRKIHIIVSHSEEVLGVEFKDRKDISIVEHKKFIPNEYLPLFNSCSIEMFLHKIPDLSERFIYLNDDMIPNAPMQESDFFNGNGVVCGLFDSTHQDKWCRQHYVNSWLSLNMITLMKGIPNECQPKMPQHVAIPHTKWSFEKVWSYYKDSIESNITKFRKYGQPNQYLFLYCNWCYGKAWLTPLSHKLYKIGENDEEIYSDLLNHTHKMICINDPDDSMPEEIYQKKVDFIKNLLAVF